MAEKYLGNKCEYASACPTYQGKETSNDMPTFLYKNVFCNRGMRGWSNCEKYIQFSQKTEK